MKFHLVWHQGGFSRLLTMLIFLLCVFHTNLLLLIFYNSFSHFLCFLVFIRKLLTKIKSNKWSEFLQKRLKVVKHKIFFRPLHVIHFFFWHLRLNFVRFYLGILLVSLFLGEFFNIYCFFSRPGNSLMYLRGSKSSFR